MSLYELTLTCTYNQVNGGTDKMLNVFNFLDVIDPDTHQENTAALAEAFLYHTFPYFLPIVHNSCRFTNILVKNVHSPTDFFESILSSLGTYSAGDVMPPYVALRYRSFRPAIGVRRAQKFIGGIPEALNGAGVVNALPTEIADLGNALNAVITSTTAPTKSFQPVLVQKEKYTPDPANPTKVAYRYYETLSEQYPRCWDLPEMVADTELTTINTRKLGRGS